MDANSPTIGDFFRVCFPKADIAAGLKRAEADVDRFLFGLQRAMALACQAVERLENTPPMPGYEPLLVQQGQHPLVARIFSYLLVRGATEAANDAKTNRTVADALRFLASPGRRRRAISQRAAVLLEASNKTGCLSTVFSGFNGSMFEFIGLLDAVVQGDDAACRRVMEIAADLAPRLSIPRGPKASAATIAHELLLSEMSAMTGSRIYTWDITTEDYTDPLTHATRLAFANPDFIPGPARRRQKRRLSLKSN